MPEVSPQGCEPGVVRIRPVKQGQWSGGVVRGDQGVGGGALETNLVPRELGVLVHGELGSVLPLESGQLSDKPWVGGVSLGMLHCY